MISTNQSTVSGRIWTNESGPLWKISPVLYRAKSLLGTSLLPPPLLVFHLSNRGGNVWLPFKPWFAQQQWRDMFNFTNIFKPQASVMCGYVTSLNVVWNLSYKACWFPCVFLGSITALAAWGNSRTVCRPQQSLHFQHCRSFASVSLAKTGITSFHWTVHSTVWFGYKKWPLPLVKHQRRPITCKITLQSSRLWWVSGFDQWEHSVLTLQTNERTESLADLWSVKESVGSVCLNFLWWKLNN